MNGALAVALVGVAVAAQALTGCHADTGRAALPVEPARYAAAPALAAHTDAWVAVSVATVWRSAVAPRPVDRPALQRPARIRRWLSDMTLRQRRELNGRADTQALLGERVRVLRISGTWVKVTVRDQPTPLDGRGYPGWVPARQLTAKPPATSDDVVTVTRRTAWLRTDDSTPSKVYEVSFGTRLPYLGTRDGWARVRTPLGVARRLPGSVVVVHAPGDPALPQTPDDLVSTAQAFTGLPYLWAGVSGFGVDCSGLTWVDHRSHGLRIARDAAPQATGGTAVTRANLRRGDLMFYATDGVVHHVTMYAGSGTMVQAPHTGASVETVPVIWSGYAGARRYLP